MIRRTLALVLAAGLLAACSTPDDPVAAPGRPAEPAAPPLGTNGAAVPELHWAPCQQKFQCATATVPVSYRDPRGPALRLAVIRLPATDPARRAGAVFVNFGGPGTDGVSQLRHFGERYPAELRARFDLISFDPRGVGGSSPISCPGLGAGAGPGGSPLRPDQRDAFYAASAAPGKACAAGSGALLNHLSTANVARDLDLLRQAVGEPVLNYLGYSYGTYLGATYANLFPDKVRAMTLDGTLDLVANSTGGPGQQGLPVDVRANTAGAQAAELDAFFDACVRAGPRCAFAAGDPRQKFADLVARLSQGSAGGTTLPALLKTVDSALHQAGRWTRLGETLNALYGAARPQGAAAARPPLLDPYLPTHSTGFLAVQCVDSDNPREPADFDRLAPAEARRVPYFGLAALYNMAQCIGWPAHDEDRYLGPWNRTRPNPVLIVNSRFDPATPLHNAEATARQLGNATVLTVDGFGHTSLNVPSACASAAMAQYFATLAVPAAGTTCAADAAPFS
ncbi:alpha/beta hydrolase [Amycolatopsis anabasis]|uniref:alpha/beta hydrolase n=1 Tax=Amycolatopsis anabasis TaxID=1840409 RepID=UPI001FE2C76C|nr:alpha/beta hydrolase [Amycolatopsis anabasis]